MRYDPGTFEALRFHAAVPHFSAGRDTPRAYLERWLAQIADREPLVKAFDAVNAVAARAAADASSTRWKAGQPLSAIDGMPIAVGRASAAARGLHDAGAVILGQTVAAGLMLEQNGPTAHPFDVTRTAGASPAAAVAACLCPVALGDQPCSRVIRSASYCANYAFVPAPGAPRRGEQTAHRLSTAGVHAGSIEDLWHVATAMTLGAGGSPMQAGSVATLPEALRPNGLIVIESAIWQAADGATRTAFEALMDQVACTGVTLLRRRDHPDIEALEQALMVAGDDHSRQRQRQRQRTVALLAALAPLADALVLLSAPGPAPLRAGEPTRATPGALWHAPALTLPLMSVDGMPVGVRLVGPCHEDGRVVALARWMARDAGTVVV